MKLKNLLFSSKNPARLFLVIYLIIVLIGTILLTIPMSSATGNWSNPLDAAFTTVSAVCVTGLVTVVTATHWSTFGHVVIIALIQLGGLGIMTAASIVAFLFNKKMSISDKIRLTEEKSVSSMDGLVKLIKFIIASTFIIEGIGAIILAFTFIPEYGLSTGIWYSIWHAISAFCNAGFDIIGDISMSGYATHFSVSMTISFLIIIAGLGHKTYTDIKKYKFNFKKYSINTKIVLIMTTALMLLPTFAFMIIEWNNPNTLGQFNVWDKFIAAFFQSATLRTAGFYSISQPHYYGISAILMIILMFIGGSPAGTAGGFKTTSFAAMFLITKANIKNEKDITIFKKRLPEDVTRKTIALFTVSIAWMFVVFMIMLITDSKFNMIDIIYEITSAYATVGLTRGITPDMSVIGKLLIMATMLFGKVGPLSVMLAFTQKSKPKEYHYPEENILIG